MINFFQRTFIYLFFVYQLSLKLSATTVIYEKLSYKPIIITNKTLKKNISFSFSAFNRTFSIRLWPVINHNASLTKNSTKTPLTNMYWEGKLLNDSLSEVNGYIKNKFFEGKIKTVNSTFFVDDITKHQDIKKNKKNSHVHSVIYYKNVSAPKDNNSTLEEIDVLSKLKKHVIKKHNLFTKVHPVRTCELSVEVDHHFFADYFSTANTRNKTKIKEDIASLVDDYISFTNQILSNYSFEGIMGLHLKLGKLLISEDDICLQNNTKYKFCDDLNTTTYIDRFFNENHQNYCLALVITNKKIIPSIELMPSQFSYLKMNYSICSAALMDYNFQSLWFFNSAILNFHVLKKKNAQSLAFAHLVTHAFGAIHDTDTECKYLTTDDKNLMYPLHVHLGDNPDHFKISNCTIEKISNFLKKTLKYDPDRRLEDYETVGIIGNCLTTDHTRDFCGNQIVGPKEECDCGYSQEDCETIGDKCCQFPQFASLESSCTFKKNGICNPVKDACCNPKTCEKFSITDEKICNKSFECHQASICNGSSTCPENIPLLDYTPCQKGTKICLNGQCVSNPLLTKPKTLNEETDNNYLLIFGVILIITAIGLGLFYFYKKELNLNKI